jgi:queuine tRNA-ribosyltransferase
MGETPKPPLKADLMPALATPGFAFTVHASDGAARTGTLTTPHGDVATPTFMPVGTQGSVKTLTPSEVEATGARIVLGNTYHLWLRPGPEVVAHAGGLHRFTRWPHAMLTDSGGFQAFSLAERRSFGPDGFVFRSHLDGEKRLLSPEVAMTVQGALGADIAMQLDVCPPGEAPRAEVEAACRTTTAWARRCLQAKAPGQALFGRSWGRCPSTGSPSAASAWASPSPACTRWWARSPRGSTRPARVT